MKKQAGNTLAATLVTMVILLLLLVAFFKGSSMFGVQGSEKTGRADGKGKTVPGLVKANAQDEVCKSNLFNCRSAISLATDPVEGTFPASLEDTKLGASMYKCVFGEPYKYDPATGEVHCEHPGHEKY